MRIDNQTHRNNSNPYQHKNKIKKVKEKINDSHHESDQLDLSSEIILLNRLLDEPNHQYIPLPFYFLNATKRNSQNAERIVVSIKEKATLHEINLNHEMILDLVLSRSNEQNQHDLKTQKTENLLDKAEYKSIQLHDDEAAFFEKIHYKCQHENQSLEPLYPLATEYTQLLQIKGLQFKNTKIQALQLRWIVINSTNVSITNNKKSLIEIIETITT